ncbi:MAG: glycosyltransferase [Geminicoccaceae bacterium]|nr:glycosyltransferase [Geminicoccaceae bacterium]
MTPPTARHDRGDHEAPAADRRTDVAVLLPHLHTGGAELSMLRIARGLAERRLAVDIVPFGCGGELVRLGSARLRPLGEADTSTLRVFPKLVRYLREAGPRAVVSGQPHLNIALLAAAKLARTDLHTVLIEHAPLRSQIDFEGGWRYRILPLLVPLAYRGADHVVAVSEGVRSQLASLLPGRRIALVRNPVLPANLPDLLAAPADHPWLGDGGPPVVMGIGRLAPEKDFPTLVRAVAHLNRRRPVRLMILGEGRERGRIEAVAAEAGIADRVMLPGVKRNVFASLARAAVFALSSRFEGFGNVLVEALAAGLPVVSTDCPVGPREILQGGRFGRLVPMGDAGGMAVALDAALDAAGPPPGTDAYVRQFSVEESVDRYLALITEPSRLPERNAPLRLARSGAKPRPGRETDRGLARKDG